MPVEKKLSSAGEKIEAAQTEMQRCEQHFNISLTEKECSSIVEKALSNLKSPATPSEVKAAVGKQMFALLAKKDPARAAQVKVGKEKGSKPAQKKKQQ